MCAVCMLACIPRAQGVGVFFAGVKSHSAAVSWTLASHVAGCLDNLLWVTLAPD
jgi:hypothetical protein